MSHPMTSWNKLNKARNVFLNLWACVLFLCAFGLIMVYSTTSYKCGSAATYNYNSMYLLKRQGLFMVFGFILMLVGGNVDYHILKKKFSVSIYVISLVCILLLLTPLGVSVNGATRWLNVVGVFQFQVAEAVKISVILLLAYMVNEHFNHLDKMKLTIYLWLVGSIPTFMLFFISNDLSSALVVLGMTYLTSLICARTYKIHFGIFCAVGIVVLIVLFAVSRISVEQDLSEMSFRVVRILAWLNPEKYADGKSYQTMQSLYAIGSGGLFGKGLGRSSQKYYMLPESHTDMIFSIICEELGIVGALLLIILFVYLLYNIVSVAMAADLFGAVLAIGVFLHVGIQMVINIAVALNIFPNTGLPLPFISYGGTSVCFVLIEMALVLSIARCNIERESKCFRWDLST